MADVTDCKGLTFDKWHSHTMVRAVPLQPGAYLCGVCMLFLCTCGSSAGIFDFFFFTEQKDLLVFFFLVFFLVTTKYKLCEWQGE